MDGSYRNYQRLRMNPDRTKGQSVNTTNLIMQNYKLTINITAVNNVSDS